MLCSMPFFSNSGEAHLTLDGIISCHKEKALQPSLGIENFGAKSLLRDNQIRLEKACSAVNPEI